MLNGQIDISTKKKTKGKWDKSAKMLKIFAFR
jgi:hypothetical protein